MCLPWPLTHSASQDLIAYLADEDDDGNSLLFFDVDDSMISGDHQAPRQPFNPLFFSHLPILSAASLSMSHGFEQTENIGLFSHDKQEQ